METKTYTLSELASIKYGKNQKKVMSEDGTIPIYGTGGLMGYATEYLYNKPSVLIGRKGTIDKVRYIEEPFWTVDTLFYTQINDDIVLPRYLYYVLSLLDLGQYNEGTTIPSLRTETLNRLEFDIPSLHDQEKILSYIVPIEEKIEINNKITRNLYSQIATIFKSWVVDKDKTSEKMPDNWSMKPLKDLCVTVTKGTTPTTLGKQFKNSGINFIKAESILENHYIDNEKFAYIDEETNLLLKRSIIQKGDILFTIAGSLGRFSLVDDSVTPANTNQAVAIIRPNSTLITSEYLYSFFVGNWHNDYYSRRIQQAVQANLSLTTIKSLPIVIMDEINMKKYTKLVTPLILMIKSVEQEYKRLLEVRGTILPKLMSGEIDLTDIDI